MYVFVSWAYTSYAKEAEATRLEWVEQLKQEGKPELAVSLTPEVCLPEYSSYLKALDDLEGSQTFDEFNQEILAIRFVIPALERVATYQLSKRLPGSGKLPASVAARALLLNSFEGLWVGEKPINSDLCPVKFVGLKGTKEFFRKFALACGAYNHPLPFDLWNSSEIFDLLDDDDSVRNLLEQCAQKSEDQEEANKYRSLLLGWMGTGTSAEKESGLNVAVGLKLGIK